MMYHETSDDRSGTVQITLGGGNILEITPKQELLIYHPHHPDEYILRLGKATKERLTAIQGYLERLKCHCPSENGDGETHTIRWYR